MTPPSAIPREHKSGLPYRPCVGVMLVNPAGLVFTGQRLDQMVEAWQMPQGGIDKGEAPYEAAVRELFEETGVSSAKLLAEAPDWYSYDLPRNIADQAWKGRYRGQRQKWFAFRFEGEETEIRIDNPPGGHKPEFDAWRWEAMDLLPALIIPFKRPVYENVVAAFRHLGPKLS